MNVTKHLSKGLDVCMGFNEQNVSTTRQLACGSTIRLFIIAHDARIHIQKVYLQLAHYKRGTNIYIVLYEWQFSLASS